MIRIGPAGWSYKDWEGVVYPLRPKVDQLQYLVSFFNTIEINNSFYRPISPSVAESWLRRSAFNQDFRFTLKIWRQFTHEPAPLSASEIAEWKEGALLLKASGKLGTVLVQFPWSFKNNQSSRDRLGQIVEHFGEFPLVAEFRHVSWNREEVFDFLRDLKVGTCNIDQPLLGKSIPPQSLATSPVGYFRCHGRNYRNWFREDAGRDARYDYLYSQEELNEQADLVRDIQEKAEDVYAIYNNHYRGQAVVNALQLRKELEKQAVEIPEPLQAAYPEAWGGA
jgi:uncharacterized protein YecE (DUF72 family)